MSYKSEHEIWLDELQQNRRARPGLAHMALEAAAAVSILGFVIIVSVAAMAIVGGR